MDEEQNSEDKTKFLNIIQKHVDRLNSIIKEDLLTLTTLEKDEKEDDFELTEARADSIINNVKRDLRSKG